MNTSRDDRHPMAEAMEWVSQITAIALEIVGFIWLGRYLDGRWGTDFWALVGLFLGPIIGFWHLLLLTGVVGKRQGKHDNNREHPDS